MHPHTQAILISIATTLSAGAALLALVLAGQRRRKQGRSGTWWYVAATPVGLVAACGACLSFIFLGMTINGGSYERRVVEVAGVVRQIERRNMWGRSGMCFQWDEHGKLDRAASGYFSGDKKTGTLTFEEDAVGFRDENGKCGPWLFLQGNDEPDLARSCWFKKDKPLPWPTDSSMKIVDQADLDDLLLAWKSR